MAKRISQKNYDWIDTPPAPEEIEIKNGAEFLPIGVVEKKLYRLDSHWGTENYKSKFFSINGVGMFSASHELVITYGGRNRRLTGAATVPIPADVDFLDPEVNSNLDATAKSECTKNAAKPIGLAFGQGLNDRLTFTAPQQQTPVKGKGKGNPVVMKADKAIQEQYNIAVENDNKYLMKSIQSVYPDIQYTGTKQLNGTEC